MWSRLLSLFKEVLLFGLLFVVFGWIYSLYNTSSQNSISPKMVIKAASHIGFVRNSSRPLVVHFWATWCPVCKMEIDNFKTPPKGADLILVATQSKEVSTFCQNRSIEATIVEDPKGELASLYGIERFPQTLFYTKDDRFDSKHIGYLPSALFHLRLSLVK